VARLVRRGAAFALNRGVFLPDLYRLYQVITNPLYNPQSTSPSNATARS
jgi:hypothetical protein